MYSADWFSNNIPNWEKWLAKFKGKPDLRFLEIGCFEGKATVWLLENILTDKSSYIDTIDSFTGGMEADHNGAFFSENAEKNYYENIKPFKGQVYTVKGLSNEALRLYDLDYFDFVYIDGSHRSPEVLEDTILAWGLLKVGGVMIWDDYKLNRYIEPRLNPKMAIDAFLEVFEGRYKMINKGYQVCIEKVKLEANLYPNTLSPSAKKDLY